MRFLVHLQCGHRSRLIRSCTTGLRLALNVLFRRPRARHHRHRLHLLLMMKMSLLMLGNILMTTVVLLCARWPGAFVQECMVERCVSLAMSRAMHARRHERRPNIARGLRLSALHHASCSGQYGTQTLFLQSAFGTTVMRRRRSASAMTSRRNSIQLTRHVSDCDAARRCVSPSANSVTLKLHRRPRPQFFLHRPLQ